MHHRAFQAAGLGLILLAAVPVPYANALSDLAQCRLDLAHGAYDIADAFHSSLNNCMRFRNYSCGVNEAWAAAAYEATRSLLSDSDSACVIEYQSGTPVDEIYPGVSHPSWSYSGGFCLPTGVGEDLKLEDPLFCQQDGLYRKLLDDLDFPPEPVSSTNEHKCLRRSWIGVMKAIRAGVRDRIECATSAGEPPWNCPLSTGLETRFGSALEKSSRMVAKCKNASGIRGQVSGAVVRACNEPIVSVDDLASCMRRISLCQTCLLTTHTLGLNEDCAAISGDRQCNSLTGIDFGKPEMGDFFVTNEGEDTMTMFHRNGSYAFGDLAASSFASGAAPVDVVIIERSSAVATVNFGGSSVTLFDAGSGDHVSGTLAASTTPVGMSPVAAAIHPENDILYVINAGEDSVTFLDAHDGSYVYGTLAASTFPTGADPSSVAVDPAAEILYVANRGDDTVSWLDAVTGTPLFGTLALSSFPAGNAPSAVAFLPDDARRRLVVASEVDSTILLLDADTGSPSEGSVAASTFSVAAGPTSIAVLDWEGPNAFVGGELAPAISAWRDGQPWETVTGSALETTVALDTIPSDLAVGEGGRGQVIGSTAQLLVTARDLDMVGLAPVLSHYSQVALSPLERATLPVEERPDHIVANAPGRSFVISTGQPDSRIRSIDEFGEELWVTELGIRALGLAYHGNSDTVHVATSSGMIYLDGTSGAYKFGSAAASTFACGCAGNLVLPVEIGAKLYVSCGEAVAVLDAATGACQGGQTPAIEPAYGYIRSVAVDPVAGILYAVEQHPGYYQSPGSEGYVTAKIIRYDTATGLPYGGNVASAALLTTVGDSNLPLQTVLSADGSTLYANGEFGIRAYETATGSVVRQRATGSGPYGNSDFIELVLDEADNRVLVLVEWSGYYAPSELLYLEADTLDFVGADQPASSVPLGIGHTVNYANVQHAAWNPALGIVAVTERDRYDDIGLPFSCCDDDVGPGLTLLDAVSPGFEGTTLPALQFVATGDSPSAVAAMPEHTH